MSKGKRTKDPISVTHPYLLEEWDFSKNDSLLPEEVTPGSNKNIWWVCKVCGYSWKATISNRTKKTRPSGCPACAGRVVTERNSLAIRFPYLCKEWDFDKNKKRGPNTISYGSTIRVWWVCQICGFSWRASPNTRTGGQGCPACAGRAVTDSNRLNIKYSAVSEDWNFEINENGPEEYAFTSHKSVWWKCRNCAGVWRASIYNRTRNNSGCPYCSGHKVSDKNRLSIKYPEVCKEWCLELNGKNPSEFSYNSHKMIWWKCLKCYHTWKTKVYSRTVCGNGCPKCSVWGVSKISQKWLDILGVPQKNREHYIKGLDIRVDGFDTKTNTVYEFLGDYWHGNPEVFLAGEINPTINKTFGQLYEETLERVKLLKSAGYKVVFIWENEFKRGLKNVKRVCSK